MTFQAERRALFPLENNPIMDILLCYVLAYNNFSDHMVSISWITIMLLIPCRGHFAYYHFFFFLLLETMHWWYTFRCMVVYLSDNYCHQFLLLSEECGSVFFAMPLKTHTSSFVNFADRSQCFNLYLFNCCWGELFHVLIGHLSSKYAELFVCDLGFLSLFFLAFLNEGSPVLHQSK